MLFALACLIPLSVVVLFFLERSIERNTEQLIESEETIASLAEGSLTGYLERNFTSLNNLSQNGAIIALEPATAQAILGQATTVRPELGTLFLLNARQQVVSPMTNPPTELISAVSGQIGATLESREQRVSRRVVIDAETSYIIMTVPVIAIEAGEEGEAAVPDDMLTAQTEADPGAATQDAPLPGEVVGVLGGALRVESLEGQIVPFALGQAEIAIVSDEEVVISSVGIRQESTGFMSDRQPEIARALSGESDSFRLTDANGDERIGVFHPISFDAASWAVFVTAPTPGSFAETLFLQSSIVLALAGLVILALAIVLGEFTARPLRTLATKASALQRGERPIIEPIGSGEVLSLSTALAEMSDQLQSQVSGLEASRTERGLQAQQMRELHRRTLRLQEDERRRIAAEIHDAVSPLITGALYTARALQMTNGSTPEQERESSLANVNQLLERASVELHGVIFDLRPPDLDDLGVVAAIEAYVQTIQRTGLTCTLEVIDEPPPLTPEVRLGIYRIVQEALHNVVRHAAADEAVVRMESTDDALRVTIRDNGAGFDPDTAIRPTSLGLMSMRERAAAIGAELRVVSRPSGGTAVILERTHTGDLMSDDVFADLLDTNGTIPPNGSYPVPDGEPAADDVADTSARPAGGGPS